MSDARRRLGRAGERRAARYLRRRGLRILARNWTVPGGEIDLVARDGDVLVVVEVRTARTAFAGGPLATVGPDKQRRLLRLAARCEAAIRAQGFAPSATRIDVVGVVCRSRRPPLLGARWELTWVRDAVQS